MDTNLFLLLVKASQEASSSGTSTSTLVIMALIAALPPTLVALAGWFKSQKVEKDVAEVHLSINSRLEQLLKGERVAGELDGRTKATQEAVVTASTLAEARGVEVSVSPVEMAEVMKDLTQAVASMDRRLSEFTKPKA